MDNLDRILSAEKEILPSSGFVSSVMEAVQREAVTPPPISFPWKRALPGLAVTGITIIFVLVTGLVQFIRGSAPQPLSPVSTPGFACILEAAKHAGADWILLALLLTWVSVKSSMRLVGARG